MLSRIKIVIKSCIYLGTYNTMHYIHNGIKLHSISKEIKIYKELIKYGCNPFDIRKNSFKISINNHNILLRRFTSDYFVFKRLIIQNEYYGVIDIIKKYKVTIKTIIDAGSNIGLATIYFNNLIEGIQFICIEPNEDNFKQLEYNIKSNKIDAILYKCGLWNSSVKLYSNKNFRDRKHWSFAVSDQKNDGECIESITINDIVKNNKINSIDLLKIDIEGSEFKVLSNNLDFLKITKIIAIEIHKEFGIVNEILDLLLLYGFKLSKSGEYFVGINLLLI